MTLATTPSKTFTDLKNRKWTLEITWATCKRIKNLTSPSITIDDLVPKTDIKSKDGSELRPLQELIMDPMRLFDVVWAICRPDYERLYGDGKSKNEKGEPYSPEQYEDDFGGGFDGSVFEAAALAFCKGLEDFFQNPVRKSLIRKLTEKGRRAMQAVATRLEKEMDKLDVDKEINLQIDKTIRDNEQSKQLSLSSQDQSPVILTPERSAS